MREGQHESVDAGAVVLRHNERCVIKNSIHHRSHCDLISFIPLDNGCKVLVLPGNGYEVGRRAAHNNMSVEQPAQEFSEMFHNAIIVMRPLHGWRRSDSTKALR